MEGDSAGDMGLGTLGFMGDRWPRIRGAGSLGVGDGGDQHSGCRTLHGDCGSDADHVVILASHLPFELAGVRKRPVVADVGVVNSVDQRNT